MRNGDANTPFVDPELSAMAARFGGEGLHIPDPTVAPLGEIRHAHIRLGQYLSNMTKPRPVEREIKLDGPHGDIPARLYRNDAKPSGPLLVYFHGGGFAYGSLDGWDMMLREITRQSDVSVLSVGYLLAPEHRFPVAADEAAFTLSLAEMGDEALGFSPDRFAAGGDSAGANLALGAALTRRHSKLRLLMLFYGAFSCDVDSPSWAEFGSGAFGLSRAQMQWVWSNYLGQFEDRTNPRAVPLEQARQRDQTRVLQIVGALDPLIDDATAFATAFDEAGLANELRIHQAVNHGFARYPLLLGAARLAVAEASERLAFAMRDE
jgi:acetyl esterase